MPTTGEHRLTKGALLYVEYVQHALLVLAYVSTINCCPPPHPPSTLPRPNNGFIIMLRACHVAMLSACHAHLAHSNCAQQHCNAYSMTDLLQNVGIHLRRNTAVVCLCPNIAAYAHHQHHRAHWHHLHGVVDCDSSSHQWSRHSEPSCHSVSCLPMFCCVR